MKSRSLCLQCSTLLPNVTRAAFANVNVPANIVIVTESFNAISLFTRRGTFWCNINLSHATDCSVCFVTCKTHPLTKHTHTHTHGQTRQWVHSFIFPLCSFFLSLFLSYLLINTVKLNKPTHTHTNSIFSQTL